MPARYLSEGRQTERQSPNPRGYTAQEMPAIYPHGYGYAVKETFAYDDPGAPSRVPRKSCRCQYDCACSNNFSGVGSANSAPACHDPAEAPSSRWRKDTNISSTASHHHQQQQQQRAQPPCSSRPRVSAVQVPSRSPSPSAVLACSASLELSPAQAGKKSDWENLLGAVDLELRAQRAERVPEPPAARAVPRFEHHHHHHHHHADRSPLHHSSVGANRYLPSGLAASVSPELGPRKPTHRRGGGGGGGGGMGMGDEVAGGGPAYSGSTADAACLLATLPQRMLDRASTSTATATPPPATFKPLQPLPPTATPSPAVFMPSPAVVSAVPGGSAPAPIRVQASGRRGPRGQSRFKGVCITRAGKWRAVIYIGRKQKYLGVFDSEFDAARAYDAAALQHFAEGAKLNFPDGVEQQLNEISSGSCGKPFETAGAGGAAAARSSTPPAIEEGGGLAAVVAAAAGGGGGAARKRSRKSAFGHQEDDEWVREGGPWKNRR